MSEQNQSDCGAMDQRSFQNGHGRQPHKQADHHYGLRSLPRMAATYINSLFHGASSTNQDLPDRRVSHLTKFIAVSINLFLYLENAVNDWV